MYFDKFDICEAYYIYLDNWNVGGTTNRWYTTSRRNRQAQSISAQLHRMQFKPSPFLSEETLTDNGRAIYNDLVNRWES